MRGGARGISGCSAKFSRGGALEAGSVGTPAGATVKLLTAIAQGISAAEPEITHNAQCP